MARGRGYSGEAAAAEEEMVAKAKADTAGAAAAEATADLLQQLRQKASKRAPPSELLLNTVNVEHRLRIVLVVVLK